MVASDPNLAPLVDRKESYLISWKKCLKDRQQQMQMRLRPIAAPWSRRRTRWASRRSHCCIRHRPMSIPSITSISWTTKAKTVMHTTLALFCSTTKMNWWTACHRNSSKFFKEMLYNCAMSSSWWTPKYHPASSTAWLSMNSLWCWNSNKSTSWWSSSCSRWLCRVSRSSEQWVNSTVRLHRIIRGVHRSSSGQTTSKEAARNNNACGQSSANKNSKCTYNTWSSNRKKWGRYICCSSNNSLTISSRRGTPSAQRGSLISIHHNK